MIIPSLDPSLQARFPSFSKEPLEILQSVDPKTFLLSEKFVISISDNPTMIEQDDTIQRLGALFQEVWSKYRSKENDLKVAEDFYKRNQPSPLENTFPIVQQEAKEAKKWLEFVVAIIYANKTRYENLHENTSALTEFYRYEISRHTLRVNDQSEVARRLTQQIGKKDLEFQALFRNFEDAIGEKEVLQAQLMSLEGSRMNPRDDRMIEKLRFMERELYDLQEEYKRLQARTSKSEQTFVMQLVARDAEISRLEKKIRGLGGTISDDDVSPVKTPIVLPSKNESIEIFRSGSCTQYTKDDLDDLDGSTACTVIAFEFLQRLLYQKVEATEADDYFFNEAILEGTRKYHSQFFPKGDETIAQTSKEAGVANFKVLSPLQVAPQFSEFFTFEKPTTYTVMISAEQKFRDALWDLEKIARDKNAHVGAVLTSQGKSYAIVLTYFKDKGKSSVTFVDSHGYPFQDRPTKAAYLLEFPEILEASAFLAKLHPSQLSDSDSELVQAIHMGIMDPPNEFIVLPMLAIIPMAKDD